MPKYKWGLGKMPLLDLSSSHKTHVNYVGHGIMPLKSQG